MQGRQINFSEISSKESMETTAYQSIKSAPARAMTTWKPSHVSRKQEPVPEEVGGNSLHSSSGRDSPIVQVDDNESNGQYA